MSQALITRLREQRQFKKAVTDSISGRVYTFLCRRPTDHDATEFDAARGVCAICQQFVVGWEGVTENDVVGGGGSDALAFDPLLWREWVADRKDFWPPLSDAILDAYKEHRVALEDAAKNSQPGSSNAK